MGNWRLTEISPLNTVNSHLSRTHKVDLQVVRKAQIFLLRINWRVYQLTEHLRHCIDGLVFQKSILAEMKAYILELVQDNKPVAIL